MVKEAKNVIIRNLGVKKVLADNGDALAVRKYILRISAGLRIG